jgi:hypothetical protein
MPDFELVRQVSAGAYGVLRAILMDSFRAGLLAQGFQSYPK